MQLSAIHSKLHNPRIFVPCETSKWLKYFCYVNTARTLKFSSKTLNKSNSTTVEYKVESSPSGVVLSPPLFACPTGQGWLSVADKCFALYGIIIKPNEPVIFNNIMKPPVVVSLTREIERTMCNFKSPVNVRHSEALNLKPIFDFRLYDGWMNPFELHPEYNVLMNSLSLTLFVPFLFPVTNTSYQYMSSRYSYLFEVADKTWKNNNFYILHFITSPLLPLFAYFDNIDLSLTDEPKVYFCETEMITTVKQVACHSNYFQCLEGTCVAYFERCDGETICPDGSDEKGCHSCVKPGTGAMYSSLSNGSTSCWCTAFLFKCLSGECVMVDKVCNGFNDCADATDELMCPDWHITSKHHRLSSVNTSGYIGDLRMPVVNKWSMSQLIDYFFLQTGQSITVEFLGQVHTLCENIGHIDIWNLCLLLAFDGVIGFCPDGSHLQRCQQINCQNRFKCNISGVCIPLMYVCNGQAECEAGQDEEHCNNLACPGMLKCSGSGTCLETHEICNGVVSCTPYGDDELYCFVCPPQCICKGLKADCFFDVNNVNQLIIVGQSALKGASIQLQSDRTDNVTINLFLLRQVLSVSLDSSNISTISYTSTFSLTDDRHLLTSHIKVLSLNDNKLHSLCCYVFTEMILLLHLSASHNMIDYLDDATFTGAVNMRTILLTQNNIRFVGKHVFDGNTQLTHLDLRKNPLILLYWDSLRLSVNLQNFWLDSAHYCCALVYIEHCYPDRTLNSRCSLKLVPLVYQPAAFILGLVCILLNLLVFLKLENWYSLERSSKRFLALLDAGFGAYLIVIGSAFHRYKYSFMDDFRAWQSSPLCLICSFVFLLVTEMSTVLTCFIGLSRAFYTLKPFAKKETHKRATIFINSIIAILVLSLGYLYVRYMSIELEKNNFIFQPDIFCNVFVLHWILILEKHSFAVVYGVVLLNLLCLVSFTIAYGIVYTTALKGFYSFSGNGRKPTRTLVLFCCKCLRLVFHNNCYIVVKIFLYMKLLYSIDTALSLSIWHAVIIYPYFSLLNTWMYYLSHNKCCK